MKEFIKKIIDTGEAAKLVDVQINSLYGYIDSEIQKAPEEHKVMLINYREQIKGIIEAAKSGKDITTMINAIKMSYGNNSNQ